MSKLRQLFTLALVALGITAFAPLALAEAKTYGLDAGSYVQAYSLDTDPCDEHGGWYSFYVMKQEDAQKAMGTTATVTYQTMATWLGTSFAANKASVIANAEKIDCTEYDDDFEQYSFEKDGSSDGDVDDAIGVFFYNDGANHAYNVMSNNNLVDFYFDDEKPSTFSSWTSAEPPPPLVKNYVTNIVDVANARLVVPKGEYTGLIVTLTNSTLTIDSPIAVGDGGITVNGDVTIVGGSNTAVIVKEAIAPNCSNIVIRATKDVTIEKNLAAWGAITIVGDSVIATGTRGFERIGATKGDVRITATGDNAPLNISRYTIEATDGNVFLDAGGDITLVSATLNAKDKAKNDVTKGNIMLSAGGCVEATRTAGVTGDATGTTFRADRDLELRALGAKGVGIYNYSYAESKHGGIRLVAENASGTASLTIGSGSCILAKEGNLYLYGDIATIGSGTDDEKGAAYVQAETGDVLVQSVRGSVNVATYLAGNSVTILANKNTSAKSGKGAVVFESPSASVNAFGGTVYVEAETGDIDINDGAMLKASDYGNIFLWAKGGVIAAKSGKGTVEGDMVATVAKDVTGVEIKAETLLKDGIEVEDPLSYDAPGRKAWRWVLQKEEGEEWYYAYGFYEVIDFTCERTVVEDEAELEGGVYMAKPTMENGGAFSVATNGALTAWDGTFKANRTTEKGGAIYNEGTVDLDCAEFFGNEAAEGGAIYNAKDATVNLGHYVFLATTNDTIVNYGTLNWNLWEGCYGLEGYQNLANYGKLQLTVADYETLPQHYTVAQGDLADVMGKDKFVLTNAVNGDCGELWIGAPVKQIGELGYQLVEEDGWDDYNWTSTTNLVLKVLPLGTRIVVNNGDTTNLVDTTVTAEQPDGFFDYGGAACVYAGGTLSAENAMFEANRVAETGGAIYNKGVVNLADVTFRGNKAPLGGAINNEGTINLGGDVTLATADDTLCNSGTLNWNLTDGKAGCLNGFENLENTTPEGTCVLTVEDYPAMPTNFVVATGSENAFAALADGFVLTNVTEEVSGVVRPGEPLVQIGQCGYQLVAEDYWYYDEEEYTWKDTTRLILRVYGLTDRIVVEAGDVATNLVSGTVYTAAPATEYGGVFCVNWGATLTGTNVTFAGNETTMNGGAICILNGTVALTNAVFKGNKAKFGGAIYNTGTLSLGGITFEGNTANTGGAIFNLGTVHFDGPVTLVTTNDVIKNGVTGTLNWNLAGGKQGVLNGYDKLTKAGTLRLTVEDYAAMPTNFVIATGDFSDVKNKDTFSITNVTTGATGSIKIGGLTLMDGTWWELVIEGEQLVFAALPTAKLSDVEIVDEKGATNATAVVTVNGVTIKPDANGNYNLPQGYPVILNYTAQDDYMFQAGLKNKKVVLDPLTGDISMDKTGYKPFVEDAWADVREIVIDTRERIVVGDPNDVLPLAYSTNNWGEVATAQTTVYYFRDGEYVQTVVDTTNENGYVEWQPTYEEYGKYTFWQSWYGFSGEYVAKTNANIYYSQPYALTVKQPAGGKITADAFTLEDGTVLGRDFVDVEVTPYDGYNFKGWSVRDAETGVEITNVTELAGRFEMPNADAVLAANFVKLAGVTVNGTDISEAEGDGWSYDGKTLKIATDDGTATNRFEIGGARPNGMGIVAKNGSQCGETATLVLDNFTNDVSRVEGTAALKLDGKAWRVELAGANYLAAGADESAVVVEATMAEFTTNALDAAGALVAVPGASTKILPGIDGDVGNVRITGGTYTSTVDPSFVPATERLAAFSNGDGTWTVKNYVTVTFKDDDKVICDVICAKGECIPAAYWPENPTKENEAFAGWQNEDGEEVYPLSTFTKDTTTLDAQWEDPQATYIDEKGVKTSAPSVEKAITNAPAGSIVITGTPTDVTVDKPVVIIGLDSVDVTPAEGSDLAVAYSTNDVLNAVYAVVGKKTDGVVISEGQFAANVLEAEKPAETEKTDWEAATNAVATISAEGLTDFVADAERAKAAAAAKKLGSDAAFTEVRLLVEPTAADETSFTFDVKPVLITYAVTNGVMTDLDVSTNEFAHVGKVALTLQMPEGFVPMIVTHTRKNGSQELFLHPSLPIEGAEQHFVYDAVATTVTFEVDSFSEITISKSEPDRYLVTLDANGGTFADGKGEKKVYEYANTGVYRYLETPVNADKTLNFAGWTYNGSGTYANGSAFAEEGDHTLKAKWKTSEQPVTACASPVVAGSVSGAGVYAPGATVTLTATASANWQFVDWTGSPLSGVTSATASFVMPDSAVGVVANFKVADDYLAACEAQVIADRDAALEELDALALTDEERADFARIVEETANQAIGAIKKAKTPDEAFAAVKTAQTAFERTLDEASEVVDGRAVTFEASSFETTEGEALDIAVYGGKADRTTSVTLDFVKGTYTSKPTVYVDGVKAKFPIQLTWTRGEVGERIITVETKATKFVEEDRAFTLQLSAPAGIELGDKPIAMVTVEDQTGPSPSEKDYVRALAWPANGGKVSGSGEIKRTSTYRTLKATAKSYARFAGWYLPKADDVNQIDTNALISVERSLKVGLGTEYGEGTYYAYFTDVLPVASVIDPDETSEEAEGATYSDGVYYLNIGVPVSLPIGLEDESGKGSLSVSSLPSGLRYSKKTGLITGTPTKAGVKTVKVVAKNAAGRQTVYYTFDVEPLPANAVGTWNGVVRSLDDDATHAGMGTVQFSATSAGKLSAKVTTRLTGTKSFSAKSYERIDENTLGVTMTTKKGEVFQATLSLTNDWTEAQLIGTVTGGAFEKNGEEVKFAAIRNAFDKKTGEAEALELLEAYKGEYEEALYLLDGGQYVGTVYFKVQDGGKVRVKATSQNGTYSATCAGAFRITPAEIGAVQTAIRNGNKLLACDALLDAETNEARGLACDYDAYGNDTHETIGAPKAE